MSGEGKSFKKVTFGVLLFMITKGTCFFVFKIALLGELQIIIFYIFLIDSGFKQLQSFEQFLKVKTIKFRKVIEFIFINL
jgi:hypothetical protein